MPRMTRQTLARCTTTDAGAAITATARTGTSELVSRTRQALALCTRPQPYSTTGAGAMDTAAGAGVRDTGAEKPRRPENMVGTKNPDDT